MNTSTKVLAIIALALFGLCSSFYILKNSIHYNDGVNTIFFRDNSVDDPVNYRFFSKIGADTLFLDSSYVDKPGESKPITIEKSELTFSLNPTLLIYIMSTSMMYAIAFGLLLPLFDHLKTLRRTFLPDKSIKGTIIAGVLVCLTMTLLASGLLLPIITAFDIARYFNVLFITTLGPNFIIMSTTAVGGIAIFGMLLVNKSIPELLVRANSDQEKAKELASSLDSNLRFFLSVLAVLVMFSVFNTTLLQRSLTKEIFIEGQKTFQMFPTEFIYGYGLVFTVVLSIIYLPVDYHLRLAKEDLGKSFPQLLIKPASKPAAFSLFDMNESGLKNLNVFLTLLSPILGSAFSEVIAYISA